MLLVAHEELIAIKQQQMPPSERPPPREGGRPHVGEFASMPEIPVDSAGNSAEASFRPHRVGGISITFPMKLHSMLQQIEETGIGLDVISWNADGDGFILKQPEVFSNAVLPHFFRTSKLSSFQRQLNGYGFSRKTVQDDEDDDEDEEVHILYRHPLFRRDFPDGAKAMQRRGAETPPRTIDISMRRQATLSSLPSGEDPLVHHSRRATSDPDVASLPVSSDMGDHILDEASNAILGDIDDSGASAQALLSNWKTEEEQLSDSE
jgi:hypothetical protein